MLSPEKLKFIRLLHNLSQNDLAEDLGVSKNYVSMVENRKTKLTEKFHERYINAVYEVSEIKKKQKENVIEIAEDVDKEIKSKSKKK